MTFAYLPRASPLSYNQLLGFLPNPKSDSNKRQSILQAHKGITEWEAAAWFSKSCYQE